MWKQLKDFDGSICGHNMTVRVTKNDDSVKPKYSIAIGVRNDPHPFRPFLRGDLLSMKGDAVIGDTTYPEWEGTNVLDVLLGRAKGAMILDAKEHNENLARMESERIAALNGKRGGDPKANQGLNHKGKTAKKREKEARKV